MKIDKETKKQIKTVCKKKIIDQIIADLTVGREDNDLPRYNEKEIDIYLMSNKKLIKRVLRDIIKYVNCVDDEDIKDLDKLIKERTVEMLDPYDSYIREFLYDRMEEYAINILDK